MCDKAVSYVQFGLEDGKCLKPDRDYMILSFVFVSKLDVTLCFEVSVEYWLRKEMEVTKKQSIVGYVVILIRFFKKIWISWWPEVWPSVFKSWFNQHHGNPTLVWAGRLSLVFIGATP